MNPNASVERSMSVPAAASTSRAFGPPTATTAHCSVTLVQYTRRSGPLGLEPLLEPVEHRGRAAGRRGDQVAVLGQAHRDAVVEDHPVEPEHQPVADRADGEVRHPVRVHPVEERPRVRPDDVDLAERARVEQPDARADRAALARDGGVHVLAVSREVARALPLADVLEDGAARSTCHVVDRRHADRVEQVGPPSTPASAANGTGVYGGRAFVGPCAPGAQPSSRVHDLGGQDAAGAALVDRRADVRRALHVLGARSPPVDGRRDVGDGLIALGLDELLGIVARVDDPDGNAAGRSPAAAPDDVQPGGPVPSWTKHALASS